ncbi:unnamed protein product [Bursaphelenchus okinawaensis]|uniref:Uncharacterized protein n=1 Tax=Bursaphelenchus okinawaensis TaxID=465554 RepID=A0A811KND1_9BILA|nr:unnamed protein product [Bursaphelenchus okinawaensis]CAG9107448.1 unnamed protein product [Bursaphelenchus okinawaensis]
MNKHDNLFNNNNQSTTVLVDEDSPDSFEFRNWQSRHVLNWLKGLDDALGPFIRLFAQNHVDGEKLAHLDNDRLRRLGINKEKLQCKITNSIDLLYYYEDEIDNENAQKLALKVTVCVQNLLNAVKIATPIILNPNQSSRTLVVLNSVLLFVADLHEDVAKLIFWLDRHPFNEKKWFTEIRDQLALFINEIVDCINDPNNPKFFSVPQLLVEKGKRIQQLAYDIIHSNDPVILYTAYIQRVVLMKSNDNDWGVEFKSTANGIHLVTKVKTGNQNNLAAKIHVGDEIVEINRQSVVGWKPKNIRRKWDSSVKTSPHGGYEIEITLAKRPRETWIPITLQKRTFSNVSAEIDQPPTETERNIRDFKRKIQPDFFVRHEEIGKPRQIRSASFCSGSDHQLIFNYPEEDELYRSPSPSGPTKSPTALILTEKRPIFRRASVWTESPPAVLRSPFDRLRYSDESNAWLLLLASWAETIPKNKARSQFRNLIVNGDTIKEEDEDSDAPLEELTIDLNNLDTLSDSELENLNPKPSPVEAAEWNAPIVEDITGYKFQKRVHLESSSSLTNSLESPLANIQQKITRFFHGADSEQSASDDLPQTPLRQVEEAVISRSQSPIITIHTATPSINSAAANSKVVNVVSRKSRLAPLAEPDEISDVDDERLENSGLKPVIVSLASTSNIQKSLSSDNVSRIDHSSLESLAATPSERVLGNVAEGWIRRKFLSLDGKSTGKWSKCWVMLTVNNFFVYSDQKSKHAEVVFELKQCSLNLNSKLKTSKKHVFGIQWPQGEMVFAPFSQADFSFWIQNLTGKMHTDQLPKSTLPRVTKEAVYIRDHNRDLDSGDELESNASNQASPASRVSFLFPSRLFSRLSRRGRMSYRTPASSVAANLSSE